MNYIDAIKREDLLLTTTTNGDTAFRTTGSYALDLYSLMGALRHQYKKLHNLFIRSFYEDELNTVKIVFHLRDILKGLGERNSFRMLLNTYAHMSPNNARKLIPLVPKYGRFDDLFAYFDTPIEKDVLAFIKDTLVQDLKNDALGKDISLLSKWLPSVNTSSKETKDLAKRIRTYLKLNERDYRKMLSKLRKNRVLETYLSAKDYSFNYEHVPSIANLKYTNTFVRNDFERFEAFLLQVDKGDSKMNTKTAAVHQVTTKKSDSFDTDLSSLAQNVYYKNLPRFESATKAIIVRDGSGSMYHGLSSIRPIDIATSLAIFFSEGLPEPFKNHFITFSERPRLIKIPEGTISQKVSYVETFAEVANTNIAKVYQLLLDVATRNNLKQEDMVEQVIIISDMQFDACVKGESTYFTYFKKFEALGLSMPELIFWNVNAPKMTHPVSAHQNGTKLVSGSSQKIIELVMSNNLKSKTPYEFMLETLKIYEDIVILLKT